MIIARTEELKALRKAKETDESRFIAVYGRRRVGKTYLIREAYEYRFVFQHAGLSPEQGGNTNIMHCIQRGQGRFRVPCRPA